MAKALLIAAAWLSLIASGCGTFSAPRFLPESTAHAPRASSDTKPGDPASITPAAPSAATNPAAVPAGTTAATANHSPDQKALAEVLAEIQELGVLDRETQNQLLKDLQQADPAYWPQMVQVFRASLKYRQQQSKSVKHDDASDSEADPNVSRVATRDESPDSRNKPKRRPAKKANDDDPPKGEMARLPAGGAARLPPTDPPDGDYPRTDAPDAIGDDVAATTTPKKTKRSTSGNLPLPPTRQDAACTLPAEPVSRASYSEASDPAKKDWKGHVGQAIQSLENDFANNPADANDPARQAMLRMLYLTAGRRDEALKPITGLPAVQQDFWSKELYGLNAYLDTTRTSDIGRRAAEASVHLREASGRLGEMAPLQVRNLTFCTEVQSYGVYKKFDKYEFKPGQELLLYAEVENFISESTARGYHTALKASYQILDSRGNRVAEQEFPPTEETCQNPRRDFFVRYFVWMPKQIYNGQYTLQLSVEDTTGRKIGQGSIDFNVKDGGK